ncbi:MAG: hypothetical protein A4E61_00303 [Syntrophorhabdus sp. PtaB.Bin184]|nr:MAG: hypothetical protein A4E61_00303 [Syntrophorhabdus sp. PtaB.Bin184]
MSPGDDKSDEREIHLALEENAHGMGLYVVHPDKGPSKGDAESLGETETDEDASDEPRSRGDTDEVYILRRDACPGEDLFVYRVYLLNVLAGCYLGDDSAEALVQVRLAGDDVGPNLPGA